MSTGKLAVLVLVGALSTEGAGYLWHRWVCHAGLLRPLLKDLMRRRHFDHHMNKYAIAGLRHDNYSQSCDVAFRVMVFILVVLAVTPAAFGQIRLGEAIALASGILIYAALGGKLHSLYHVSDRSTRNLPLLGYSKIWKIFSWLRDFHDIHHVANANYSLALPIFDLIGGTYIPPKTLPALKAEDLFPLFDAELSSSCEKPLFGPERRT